MNRYDLDITRRLSLVSSSELELRYSDYNFNMSESRIADGVIGRHLDRT